MLKIKQYWRSAALAYQFEANPYHPWQEMVSVNLPVTERLLAHLRLAALRSSLADGTYTPNQSSLRQYQKKWHAVAWTLYGARQTLVACLFQAKL